MSRRRTYSNEITGRALSPDCSVEWIVAMTKIVLMIPLLLFATAASAQNGPGQQACARDVSRFCRAKMNDGDMVVLGCLKEHRSSLSKACAKVLAENNQ
jgi:hypothetical protein